jgi:hypothetical protein
MTLSNFDRYEMLVADLDYICFVSFVIVIFMLVS